MCWFMVHFELKGHVVFEDDKGVQRKDNSPSSSCSMVNWM